MGGVKALWLEDQERGWNSFRDKFVCTECFEDYAIQDVIRNNAEEHRCSYCGRFAEGEPIAADMNLVMEEIHFGICNEWGDPNSEGMSWESREGGWQGTVVDSYDLLTDILELGIANQTLFDDLHASIAERQWCQRNFYDLLPQKELVVDWQHFSNIVKHQTRFTLLTRDSASLNDERLPRDILDRLGQFFRDFGMLADLAAGTVLFRARRHEKSEVFNTMSELGPPPRHRTISSNRMSPAGIPMFYGAFDPQTAIAEVCSDHNDRRSMVTTGEFVLLKPLRVLDLSSPPEVPSLFDRQRAKDRAGSIFLRSFLMDFTKPVEKDGREHIDYVPTQVVTEYVRRIFRDNSHAEVNGAIYPSAIANGRCCVLFIDEVATGDWAHLNASSADKWLKLDASRVKTREASIQGLT